MVDPKKDPNRWRIWAQQGDEVSAKMKAEREYREGAIGPDSTADRTYVSEVFRGFYCAHPECHSWVCWGNEAIHGAMHARIDAEKRPRWNSSSA